MCVCSGATCLQYKPSRWWFDFALLYNKILFVVLCVLMDSDAQAWNLLYTLTALTTATLVLVVVDKPFRDPDGVEWEGITLADKLMIVSQLSQLVNYYVAVECLRSKESRLARRSSCLLRWLALRWLPCRLRAWSTHIATSAPRIRAPVRHERDRV